MALADGLRVTALRGVLDAAGAAAAGDDDDDDDDAFGVDRMTEWDDDAPWSPWSSLCDPWASTEIDCSWTNVPLSSLIEMKDPATGRRGDGRVDVARAPRWTLRATPFGSVGAGDLIEDSCDDGERGGRCDFLRGGSNAGVGLAEMFFLLARAAGGTETVDVPSSTTMSALASEEHWDEIGRLAPRAPPESVVQDVLRDIFDVVGGVGGERGRGKGKGDAAAAAAAAARVSSSSAAECSFPNPPRSAPPGSLLARVAMHALQFGNVRAVSVLWRRFTREIRFAHWDRGVPLPRFDAVVTNDDGEEEEELPDANACLLHQKLQLLNLCIHRRVRASKAAFEASAVANV